MKRQNIRKALIFILFLLFPVVMFYLSPMLIIEGASQGIITGSFIAFSLMFIFSLVLGRGFCGWVCPGAGLQEACFRINNKRAKGGKYNWIKYLIWIPWIGIIAFMAIKGGGFRTIDPFFQIESGISIAEPANYIVYYFIIGLITTLSLTVGRRAFCHYGCWMAPFMVIGTKIRHIFRWPGLQLKVNKDRCKNCKTCTKNCPMSLEVNYMVQKGSMRNSECILCGTCVDGCPEKVIKYAYQT